MAREASTLSLVTCHAGFFRRGIDPVGETIKRSRYPSWLAAPCRFTAPHSRTGEIHGSPKRRAEKAKKVQEASNPRAANKPQERSLPIPVPASSAPLSVVNPDAAGIDVHSDMHMVCVPADRDANPVRQFGANTADLQEIAAWLKKCGVKTIALESTGIYWIPLFELLESEGFEVYPGRTGTAFALRRAPQDGRARRAVDPAVALLRPLA